MSGFPHSSPFSGSKPIVRAGQIPSTDFKPKRNLLDKPDVAAFGSPPDGEPPLQPSKPPPSVHRTVGSTNLDDMDVADELGFVHRTAKTLLTDSLRDDSIPLSQRVQAVNSLNAVVSDIAKTKIALYNAERYRTLEQVLIEVLKEYPDLKNKVLDRFSEKLKIAGGTV